MNPLLPLKDLINCCLRRIVISNPVLHGKSTLFVSRGIIRIKPRPGMSLISVNFHPRRRIWTFRYLSIGSSDFPRRMLHLLKKLTASKLFTIALRWYAVAGSIGSREGSKLKRQKAQPAAPTAEDDSWLRWCNLCGERSYWRENACLNPHCTVTRQIFVKYVIIRRCKISCNPFFVMVIVDQGGARSPAIPCIVDSCAAAGICLQRGV